MNYSSFFFLQMKKKPIPSIIAKEKTKLVMRVVTSLLFNGSVPLRILNMKKDSKEPVSTDNITMVILLLFDMLQRKKRLALVG